MSKKNQKPLIPKFGAITVFPSRVWEPGEHGWTTRSVTEADRMSRRQLAEQLQATMEVNE